MEVGVRLRSTTAADIGLEDIVQRLSECGPVSWAFLSGCIWLSYLFTQRWPRMGRWDRYQLVWGLASIVHFLYWALVVDTEFKAREANPGSGPLVLHTDGHTYGAIRTLTMLAFSWALQAILFCAVEILLFG